MTAKFLVWAFFLLVADQALVIMGSKFGLPVKPHLRLRGDRLRRGVN